MKFFLGDKYPVNGFKVKFFEFVLFAHKFDLLKIIFSSEHHLMRDLVPIYLVQLLTGYFSLQKASNNPCFSFS